MQAWLNGATDRGGVLWGILCCWLLVLMNFALFGFHTPVFYVVPFDVVGVPLIVTLALWAAGPRRTPP
jgi:hypothetical protein